MQTLSCFLEGVGLVGPGISDWTAGQAILSGAMPLEPAATIYPTPAALPATDRRRTGKVVKLALAVGLDAIEAAALDASQLATVFASSGGDNYNCHAICETLASDDRTISPTRFVNSVNNAPAGYWSIATGCQAPSTVICAYDGSFSAGMMEALTQVVAEQQPVVLMAYDTDYPEPLHQVRPIPDGLGIALVLTPRRSAKSIAEFHCRTSGDAATAMDTTQLEMLRTTIPAGRGLPLLQALARGTAGRVVLDYLDDLRLSVEVHPCR